LGTVYMGIRGLALKLSRRETALYEITA